MHAPKLRRAPIGPREAPAWLAGIILHYPKVSIYLICHTQRLISQSKHTRGKPHDWAPRPRIHAWFVGNSQKEILD